LRVNQRFFAGKSGGSCGPMVAWLFRRLGSVSDRPLELPVTGPRFLGHCHNFLWMVLGKPLRHAEDSVATLRSMEGMGQEAGFHVSAFLALWGVGRILANGLGCAIPGEPLPWREILQKLNGPQRDRLLELAHRSLLSLHVWQELGEAITVRFDPPAQSSPRLRDAVSQHLGTLSRLSLTLLSDAGSLPPTPWPYLPQDASVPVVQSFRRRQSLGDGLEANEEFHDRLLSAVRSLEEGFLTVMTLPRPQCYDRVFVWDREGFFPGEERTVRLTPGVREALAVCHNIQFVQTPRRAPDDPALDLAQKALLSQSEALDRHIVKRGDMLVVYSAPSTAPSGQPLPDRSLDATRTPRTVVGGGFYTWQHEASAR
jgi:hypothetical protein